MDLNFKKMWPVAATSLVALTSLVSADNGKMSSEGKDAGMMVINPSVRPAVAGKNWTVDVEAFYWNAVQDGLEFAIEDDAGFNQVNGGGSTTVSSLQEANFEKPGHHWDPGFRLGFGYAFNQDGYDLTAKWTRFHNRSHRDADEDFPANGSFVSVGETLLPLWSNLPTNTAASGQNNLTAGEIEHHWKLHLNVADLELGREFLTSKRLSVRPHIGLRGVWIKQRVEMELKGVGNVLNGFSAQTTTIPFDEIEMTNKYKGLGVRAGLDTNFEMRSGWSFFGNAAFSIIYGRFHVHQEEGFRGTNTSAAFTQLLDIEEDFRSSKAITDLALGLRYEYAFMNDTNLEVSLSWEHHMFFNQNQLYKLQRATSGTATAPMIVTHERGDLSTQGWTLGVSFDW